MFSDRASADAITRWRDTRQSQAVRIAQIPRSCLSLMLVRKSLRSITLASRLQLRFQTTVELFDKKISERFPKFVESFTREIEELKKVHSFNAVVSVSLLTSSPFHQLQESVYRMRVEFQIPDTKETRSWFPTCYALSPTMFVDYNLQMRCLYLTTFVVHSQLDTVCRVLEG